MLLCSPPSTLKKDPAFNMEMRYCVNLGSIYIVLYYFYYTISNLLKCVTVHNTENPTIPPGVF